MKNSNTLTILVVDDHPFTADAYINLISTAKNDDYTFLKATNCEMAYKIMEVRAKEGNPIDMALMDINLPPFEKEKILSGSDLAVILREKFPLCKIIMLTMHSEHLILNKVLKIINPEGFLSKNDIDFSTFPSIFLKIKEGENYFSPTINKSLQDLVHTTIKWDEFDTQIMLLLEKGIPTKEIPNYIDISLSTIEKRKANIKRQIADQKVSDKELINVCKKLNLI